MRELNHEVTIVILTVLTGAEDSSGREQESAFDCERHTPLRPHDDILLHAGQCVARPPA